MSEGGFRICELSRAVRIAVEREDTPCLERAPCQRVIQILPCWIAVDFDRDASLGRRRKYGVPVRDYTGTRFSDPTARMSKDSNGGVCDRDTHSLGLILALSELRMWRRQNQIESSRLIIGKVESSGCVDVRFDPLQ